jgi:hypothetical protein
MATSSAGFPVMKHFFAPSGCSKGKHLMVALVSSFTFNSSALLKFTKHQLDYKNGKKR